MVGARTVGIRLPSRKRGVNANEPGRSVQAVKEFPREVLEGSIPGRRKSKG